MRVAEAIALRLTDAHIVLGVTGSIATYKAVGLASALVQAGATVDVIMTEAATRMVQPLSFQAITHRPVHVDMFAPWAETDIGHVTLGRQADLLLVAPATANTLAKLALGLADNLLTTTALAARCPVVVAPAMETAMWHHEATQKHVTTLRHRGVTIIEPEAGHLASGAQGVGRLADEKRILATAARLLTPQDLANRHVVVTAGGTREPIDPVRFVSNASSGRMGYALAEAAAQRGARVTLISSVTGLSTPFGVERVPVESAREMHAAVLQAVQEADVLLMAAAVADYRPANVATPEAQERR
ncbi:MAG: bifunctional phosphopantothenoylcysteine decarboxylase/phosphopantothenate--cysteine ligase CoaBC [Ardenticatenia bacterium]|nr:bifunctional phosphopantothenoylcysteine decarboxylase/phosphopantothenate--cysteine ligase CoaBC [Ardenticatenia bacterium]